MNNSPNDNPSNQSPKKKSVITRWIIGGFFAMFAFANGFHYSSLFLLCAACLMFPFSFIETFLRKQNIKTTVAIILSIILFFVGATTAPPTKETTSDLNNATQSTIEDSKDSDFSTVDSSSSNNLTTPDSSSSNNTTKPESSSSNDEKIEMVWVSSSGSKYH